MRTRNYHFFISLTVSMIILMQLAACEDPNSISTDDMSSYASGDLPRRIKFSEPTSHYKETFIQTMAEIGFPGSNIQILETNSRGVYSKENSLNKTRSILYNVKYLDSVYNHTNDLTSIKSICLHELAHHFYGHPLQSKDFSYAYEVQADTYSGFQMRKLGASLSQALAAISFLGNPHASPSHPSLATRLQAITEGYYQAETLITKDSTKLKASMLRNNLNPVEKKRLDSLKNVLTIEEKNSSKWPVFNIRIETVYELLEDEIYLDDNKVILRRNGNPIGTYVESKSNDTNTVLLIGGVSYYLDEKGKIWCINPDGSRMIVGRKAHRINL